MKNKIISAVVILAVLAGAAYATRGSWMPLLPFHGVGVHKESPPAEKCVYTCPMHPQIVKEHPADCPICGMSLVKKAVSPTPATPAGVMAGTTGMQGMSAEEMKNMPSTEKGHAAAPETAAVTLDPRQMALANVRTTKVVVKRISQEIRTVGKVAVDEQSLRKVTARYAGRVERLAVNFTGQVVKKGVLMMSLYSPEMIATQKEYLIAKASAARLANSGFPEISKGSNGVVEAARTRLKLWGLTDSQIGELDRTGNVKSTVDIYSPVSGTVMEIKVRQGDYVSEGSEVYTIAALDRVWVLADVYEYEFSKAGLDSEVEVTADAFPGRVYRGRVEFIDPSVNPESRTVKVRAGLSNPGGRLKPEMFVNARIFSKSVRAIAVPASAILYTGTRDVAWVEAAPGKFEPRDVTLGLRSGDYYQVLSGLREGETVVTEGGFLIDSEAQLRKSAGGSMPGMEMGEKKATAPAPSKPEGGMKGMPGM